MAALLVDNKGVVSGADCVSPVISPAGVYAVMLLERSVYDVSKMVVYATKRYITNTTVGIMHVNRAVR